MKFYPTVFLAAAFVMTAIPTSTAAAKATAGGSKALRGSSSKPKGSSAKVVVPRKLQNGTSKGGMGSKNPSKGMGSKNPPPPVGPPTGNPPPAPPTGPTSSTEPVFCVATDTPFDAGFGDCSTYADGLTNNFFCDQDVDSNGVVAQDACAECGVCVIDDTTVPPPAVTVSPTPAPSTNNPTVPPAAEAAETPCVETSAPFDAGFGDCSTYADGFANNAFCDQDVDSNGILAQDACVECGVCVEAPACIDTGVPFNAGFGDCSTYAEGLGNNAFCDQDVDANGILAQDACAECGVCLEAVTPPTGEPAPPTGGPGLVSETSSS